MLILIGENCTFRYFNHWRRPVITVMDGTMTSRVFEIFIFENAGRHSWYQSVGGVLGDN